MATNKEADEASKPAAAHTEYGPAYTMDMARIEAAVAASNEEAKLPRKELLSRHWPAMVFSALLSLALVMEGMDVGLINNFFGQTAFKERFGWPDEKGEMQVSSTWQAAIANGNNAGSIVGLLLNGYLQSRFGSRRVYMFAMVIMACTIFVLFFAQNIEMLLAGNILCGIPWGIFQTLTTAYAAEICPPAMRGYLTAWVSMCWGSGSFLAAGVLRGSLDLPGDAAWRVPYGLQWIWIPPLFTVAFFAPESPWYLVRRGKLDEAEKMLRRLARKDFYTDETMANTLALMKHTNEMEKLEAANSNYWDCFRGTNLRRTVIVCMAWIVQILNGQGITAYATLFLQTAGMAEVKAFDYSMGIQSVNIAATAIAIVLMVKIGRRTFYMFGTAGLGLASLSIGIMGFVAGDKNVAIPVAVFMIIMNLIFKISLGPSCFTIVAEMSANRVRAQTIVLGRAVYVIGQIISGQLNPRMLTSAEGSWGWGPKAGMFYFGLDVIWFIWVFFFLPETRNRSFAEIDYLFQKKTPARKFSTAPIDCKYLLPSAHWWERLHP